MDEPTVTLDDLESVRNYLASFDLFAGNEAEGIGYLHNSLRRILTTLALIPPTPESGGRLLELGANPYFLTLLLEKFTGYELTLANYFGEGGHTDGRGTQVVTSQRYGERHEFCYDHFNGETEQFPYSDHTFDVVLNCEILEHLPLDPTHLLYECHRVLKPGGYLLLTTPNVLAFQNLWRLTWGRNIYDLYSGYGVYGRHNREYTPAEVVELLQACGFNVTKLVSEDIYQHASWARLLKRLRANWRDHTFVLAQAQAQACYAYPIWLYRSMAGLRRVTRSDIAMGENDTVQLGRGWHPLERLPFPARWTRDEARAYLSHPGQVRQLGLEANAMGTTLGATALTVKVGSISEQFLMSSSDWQELRVDLPSDLSLEKEIEVLLSAKPTRNPARLGISQDDRELGVLVKRLWLC